jgi:hypothetical protein
MTRNLFGADTDEDVTDWGQENVEHNDRLVRVGLERAAAWHDGKARECAQLRVEYTDAGCDLLARSAHAMAKFHTDAAASIRKLKTV